MALCHRAPISEEVASLLARDPFETVRRELSQNEALPLSALGTLSRDRDPYVRHAVANHRRVPLAILKDLLRDDIPRVRAAADFALQLRAEAASHPGHPAQPRLA